MKLVIAALLTAQAVSAPQTTFRSGIEVVELDVSVTRGGVPVAGLTARDFVLTDNGAAQEVQSVTLEQLPLSVTMVLDTSQSVAGDRLQHLVQAGEGLVAALHAGRPRRARHLFTRGGSAGADDRRHAVDPDRARRDHRQRRHVGARCHPSRARRSSPTIARGRCCWCLPTATIRPAG